MKKNLSLIALLLAMIMLFTCSCKKKTVNLDEAEAHLLEDLTLYIYCCEKVYANAQWAFDYVKQYDNDKSWDSLQKARAAFYIAGTSVMSEEPIATSLTEENYIVLMDAGIDASFMENNDLVLQSEQSQWNQSLNVYGSILMNGIFFSDYWDTTKQCLDIYSELLDCSFKQLAGTAEWTIASIGNASKTEGFRKSLAELCPVTYSYMSEEIGTPEEIEAEKTENLNRMEMLLTVDYEKALAAGTDLLNKMKDENVDFFSTVEASDFIYVSDMPDFIPLPEWYIYDSVSYHWEEDDKLLDSPLSGDTLEKAPNCIFITVENVTAESVKEYNDFLIRYGIPCVGESDENGKYFSLLSADECSISLSWENGTASMRMDGDPMSLVPLWFLDALNALIN